MKSFISRLFGAFLRYALIFCLTLVAFAVFGHFHFAHADAVSTLGSQTASLGHVDSALTGMSAATKALISTVLEAGFRMLPTKKPLSLIWVAVGMLHAVVKFGQALLQCLSDLASDLDQVLPQNVLQPAADPAPAQLAPAAQG